MGDAMKGSLCILGSIAFLTCLVNAAFAQESPASSQPPRAAAISDKMAGVTGELSKKVTGEPVQAQQKGIVHDLDLLIAALEKECQNCKGNVASNNPKTPMPDSMIKRGTGGIGDLVDPGQSQKDWAKLSGRERDRILQSMSEGFPPEYRTVLDAITVGSRKRRPLRPAARLPHPRKPLRRRQRPPRALTVRRVGQNGKPVPRPIHFIGSEYDCDAGRGHPFDRPSG